MIDETPSGTKPPWYKKHWLHLVAVGVIALFVGVGIGMGDTTNSPEYKALQEKYDTAKKTVGDLPEREAKVKAQEEKLAKAQEAVTSAEKSVAKREKKVGIAEKEAKANTVSGDGMYEVGSDMKPGRYKTSGSPDCYYAILNSTDTSDIADNNLPGGPAFVTVREGQYFESRGCADWVRQ